MMKNIRIELAERIGEANILIDLVSDASTMPKSINKVAISKSALFLVLYNIVESTVKMAFEEIHERIKFIEFKRLSPKLKGLYVEYHFKQKKSKEIVELLESTINSSLNIPMLDEYLKRISLFSGNLDAREVNNIFNKYGIQNLKNESRKHLVVVKNKRNKLAHGEESFKESGRGFTVEDLRKFTISVTETMTELINSVESYLLHQKYLAST